MYALWQLDADGDITVHETTVVHRDVWGDFQVDSMETQPALATALGVGIGADLMRADARSQATSETAFVLNPAESAVIADVSEDSALAIDSRVRELGGIVRRRAWSTLPIRVHSAWSSAVTGQGTMPQRQRRCRVRRRGIPRGCASDASSAPLAAHRF